MKIKVTTEDLGTLAITRPDDELRLDDMRVIFTTIMRHLTWTDKQLNSIIKKDE